MEMNGPFVQRMNRVFVAAVVLLLALAYHAAAQGNPCLPDWLPSTTSGGTGITSTTETLPTTTSDPSGESLLPSTEETGVTETGSVSGDPHLVGFHGQRFDFMGESGHVYSMISDKHFQVNTRLMLNEGRAAENMTFVSEIGMLIGPVDRVHIFCNERSLKIVLNSDEVNLDDHRILDDGSAVLVRKHGRQPAAHIRVADYDITVERKKSKNAKCFLNMDVAFHQPEDEIRDPSDLPHGVLGQTSVPPSDEDRLKTPAPGASKFWDGIFEIEGEDNDYKIDGDDIFGTSFAHTRFEGAVHTHHSSDLFEMRTTAETKNAAITFADEDGKRGQMNWIVNHRRLLSTEGVFCGCMDSTALNFDEFANYDDGSCSGYVIKQEYYADAEVNFGLFYEDVIEYAQVFTTTSAGTLQSAEVLFNRRLRARWEITFSIYPVNDAGEILMSSGPLASTTSGVAPLATWIPLTFDPAPSLDPGRYALTCTAPVETLFSSANLVSFYGLGLNALNEAEVNNVGGVAMIRRINAGGEEQWTELLVDGMNALIPFRLYAT